MSVIISHETSPTMRCVFLFLQWRSASPVGDSNFTVVVVHTHRRNCSRRHDKTPAVASRTGSLVPRLQSHEVQPVAGLPKMQLRHVLLLVSRSSGCACRANVVFLANSSDSISKWRPQLVIISALCTSVCSQPVMDETTQEMTEASDVNEAYYRRYLTGKQRVDSDSKTSVMTTPSFIISNEN